VPKVEKARKEALNIQPSVEAKIIEKKSNHDGTKTGKHPSEIG